MALALAQAEFGRAQGEVPVGAVLVRGDELLAEGFNCPISSHDSTAHAEVVTLRRAGEAVGNYRLPHTTLYVTLEPCMMCAGALVHARVERVVYGAREPKAGVVHSHPLFSSDWLNHRIDVDGGILETRCATLLKDFFSNRRTQAQSALVAAPISTKT